MANEQNLVPFTSDQSREEAAKNGRAGGIASGKARREKADLRRLCQMWLEEECGVTDKSGKPLTGAELMIKTAVREMTKGSIQHMDFVRDTAGYKPVDKLAIAEVDPAAIADVERIVRKCTADEDADPLGVLE